jgi:hypothetical protein
MGGEGRGCSSPFIGAQGAPKRVVRVVTGGVNGSNAIERRARLGGPLRRGNHGRAQAMQEEGHDRWGPPLH